jgi:hypothetical protein
VATTLDITNCTAAASDGPLAPYYSLHYNFGMLLGVADFETEQAYHRGKMRLHNAWLHREGVAWGLGVGIDTKDEIRVKAGLATDALGRELYLDKDACLNVPAWFDAHKGDAGFIFKEDDNGIVFDGHIVIRFKACLTRQVPSLSEPCNGSNSSTAYSRVYETVEIFLRPGLWNPAARPYHRLRLLFGLDQPALDGAGKVVASDLEVLGSPRNIDSFRLFAALDEIDLAPLLDTSDVVVVLANLSAITLKKADGKLSFTDAKVDVSVRPTHVATTTVQELLLGSAGVSGGPFVIPSSVTVVDATSTIELTVSDDLAPMSVIPGNFTLSIFDKVAGWSTPALTASTYDNTTRKITLTYTPPLTGSLIRLIVRGTGPTPVLGANLVPLGDGIDFISTQAR